MTYGVFVAALLLLSVLAYALGMQRAQQQARLLGDMRQLHSLPFYYGVLSLVWTALPAVLLCLLWMLIGGNWLDGRFIAEFGQHVSGAEQDVWMSTVQNTAAGYLPDADAALAAVAQEYNHWRSLAATVVCTGLLALSVLGFIASQLRIKPSLAARPEVERVTRGFLMACALIAILITVGIVLSVVFESLRFFQRVPVTEFLFGTQWSPQIAMRADQAGSSGAFGAVPVFSGTLLIATIAMLIAVPAGLMSAIFLSEYASHRVRRTMKPMLELLAGIPTVVYGFFAALTIAPFVRDLGLDLGLAISSESALVAGVVMGVMIIPFVSSLSDDVINAVPQTMRDGSLALGATQAETIVKVVIPAALPGIVGGILLAISRAIGETMIVVMAAGLTAKITANPFESVTTVTAQIATLLVGDQEFDSAKTLAAFALGLVLFVVTLFFNVFALYIVKKYREQYE